MGKDYLKIAGLSILLTLSGAALLLLYQSGFIFSAGFILLVIICIIYILIYDYKKVINEVIKLTDSIRFDDFTVYFGSKGKGKHYANMAEKLNAATENFRKISKKNQSSQNLYSTLLSVIDFGIIVFDSNNNVVWINESARRELNLLKIKTLEDLTIVSSELPQIIKDLICGDVFLYKYHIDGTPKELALSCVDFKSENETFLLLSLKNIHSLLEKEEMVAWQKLIRVLTHEIMNSITPVISLSETLTERTEDAETNDKDFDNMRSALAVIHRRSKGLLSFVENYRKLSRIPKPTFAQVNLTDMLYDICSLHNDVTLNLDIPKNTIVNIDRSQIEQVMINLIKNAREANEEIVNIPYHSYLEDLRLETNEKVRNNNIKVNVFLDKNKADMENYYSLCIEEKNNKVSAFLDKNKVEKESSTSLCIIVSDNGKGVSEEARDKIFLPFFTTKPTGSGIGLSLCKQILTMHGAKISFVNRDDMGTDFIISFRTSSVSYLP